MNKKVRDMTKQIALALLLLTSSEAWAGQIKIDAGLTANPSAFTRTRSISDSDITNRVLPALKWQFGQICTQNAQNPRQRDCRDRTNQEAMDAWLVGAMGSLTNIVSRYEKQKARAQAETGVTELP